MQCATLDCALLYTAHLYFTVRVISSFAFLARGRLLLLLFDQLFVPSSIARDLPVRPSRQTVSSLFVRDRSTATPPFCVLADAVFDLLYSSIVRNLYPFLEVN